MTFIGKKESILWFFLFQFFNHFSFRRPTCIHKFWVFSKEIKSPVGLSKLSKIISFWIRHYELLPTKKKPKRPKRVRQLNYWTSSINRQFYGQNDHQHLVLRKSTSNCVMKFIVTIDGYVTRIHFHSSKLFKII